VRLSYAAIDANAKQIAEYLELTARDRPITTLPIHYSYGLSVVTSHLNVGATIILTGQSVIDAAFWQLVRKEEVTSLAGVPYTYELLDRVGFRDMSLPSLRTLTQAGGRLPPETVRRYTEWAKARDARFFVMYGQTEATARMSYMPPARILDAPDCIGIPIPRGSFRLIDETGTTISSPGTVGELVYSGPNVMLGYALSPDDLSKGRELEELRTGDLASRDAQGLYRIVGRKSRFAKLYGLRINL
jgi:acyl-CoA synthetase (AMP-forming)/AMP-acid ligase II